MHKKYTLVLGILLLSVIALNFVVLNKSEAYFPAHNSAKSAVKIARKTGLEGVKITLHADSNDVISSSNPGSIDQLNHCKDLLGKTLKVLPAAPVAYLKNLNLEFDPTVRRGLGGGSTVSIRCVNVTDSELVGVMVHEMGHVMDTGVLQGHPNSGESAFKDGDNPIFNDDPSLNFYNIDFNADEKTKSNTTEFDFVSTYAMSDPFEDFAESYAYYILHGTEFRKLAKDNESLTEKYNFLKNQVFNGKEFDSGYQDLAVTGVRHYDVTVLPYDLKKFIGA